MLSAKSPYNSPSSSGCTSCLFVSPMQRHINNNGPSSAFQINTDQSRVKLKEAEDLLASDLSRLSVQERSKALDDVHCVGEELEETPETMETSLQEFEEVLQLTATPVYRLAESQNRSFVENPDFRLKFLRANLHDVGRSVEQMMNFLKYKALFFGNEKVAREITFDDLNKEDKDLLLAGAYHIQEGRDRKGRVVLYLFNTFLGRCKIETHSRITYYIIYNILSPMPEVQRKGLVTCYYDIAKPGDLTIPGPSFMMTSIDFLNTIPVRFSGMHHCLKTDKSNLMINSFLLEVAFKLFPHYNRARARIHYGTDIELQYSLQGLGIPVKHCPVDIDGNLRQDILNVWFHKYRQSMGTLDTTTITHAGGSINKSIDETTGTLNENETSQTASVDATPDPVTPLRHDVLLGRGKANQNNLGNVCFREFLKQYGDEYDRAPRKQRRTVVLKIRQDLQKRGIRFLQERNDEWIECSAAEAEKTIAQAFRNQRKGKK